MCLFFRYNMGWGNAEYLPSEPKEVHSWYQDGLLWPQKEKRKGGHYSLFKGRYLGINNSRNMGVQIQLLTDKHERNRLVITCFICSHTVCVWDCVFLFVCFLIIIIHLIFQTLLSQGFLKTFFGFFSENTLSPINFITACTETICTFAVRPLKLLQGVADQWLRFISMLHCCLHVFFFLGFFYMF